jgi:SAM-dependent methyltransferase
MAEVLDRDPPLDALADMIGGHRLTAVVYVAARLDLAELLADEPKRSRDLAARTGTHAPSLRRLLRAMVTMGLCTVSGTGEYALTAIGRALDGRAERSLKPWALFEGELLRRGWDGMLDTIRTGKTGGELEGENAERRFDTLAERGLGERFNEAMVALTRLVAPAVLAAYDFSDIAHLMDLGGGHGELLAAILGAHPTMRGTVVDLAHCADGARKRLAEAGAGDRFAFVGGNFFEAVPPGADAIIMKSIIHDWDDEKSVRILRNCRRALGAKGRLLLVERIMPEPLAADRAHRAIALSDLNMLRGPGGLERTELEFRELLAQGGFRITRIADARGAYVIEARPG